MLQAARDAGQLIFRLDPNAGHARRFQDRLRRLTHGHLPGVPLAVIATRMLTKVQKKPAMADQEKNLHNRRRRSTASAARCARRQKVPRTQRTPSSPS